jgi:hypothetical protein
MNNSRRGMTVFELLVALALAGGLLAGLREMLVHLADSGMRVAREAKAADRRENGEQLLHLLLRRAVVQPDSVHRFAGDEFGASFDTMCDAQDGWLAPCRVALQFAQGADSMVMLVSQPGFSPLTVLTASSPGQLRYMDPTVASEDSWLLAWGRRIDLPAAIAVVTSRDTIVLRVAVR